jgi:hypothetical protein
MKRILFAIGAATALAGAALAQQSNYVPTNALPVLNITATTNVQVQVQPLVLSQAQMALVISNLQAVGITGTMPITAPQLQRLTVVQRLDGSFYVVMQVHP